MILFVPDAHGIGETMRDDEVREALHRQAEKILPQAKRLASAAKLPQLAAAMEIEDGTRPRGRPFSRVIVNHHEGEKHEFGDNNTTRRRILGQAANVKL